MTGKKLYRTLSILALTSAAAAFTGCSEAESQKKMNEKSQMQWDNTRVGVLYQLAEQQYTVGDYAKCRETLAQAFGSKTPFASTHILAARVELENGSLEAANNHLKTAIQIDGNNAEAYYLLGVVYQRWQNLQSAHDYYALAYEKKPGDALYLLAVVEMKIALGQNDEAQKLLEDKLVYFEQSSAIRVALAKLATLKGDGDKAAHYLLEATLLSPDNLSIRQNYAEALFYNGRYSDAEPVLEDLHRNDALKDKTNVTMLLGECYMNLRRPRDARACFVELTSDDPNNNTAWLNIGRASMKLDDAERANEAARHVLNTEPKNLEALVVLALSQQKQKQWSLADATLARAAQVAPKDSTVLCMQGINAEKLGNAQKAVDIFESALKNNPGDAWAQELLAAVRPAASASIEPSKPEVPVTPVVQPTPAAETVPPVVPEIAPATPVVVPEPVIAPTAPVAPEPIIEQPVETPEIEPAGAPQGEV